MKQLLNNFTFFLSFNKLFSSFQLIPIELIPFFNYCFRSALKKKILINRISVLITSVLATDQYEAINFFFSAIMEDQSILASYINLSNTFYLLDFDTKSSKLPISYLKFLLFIDNQPLLTESQIMSIFLGAPLLAFDFVERYSIDKLNDIWSTVLNNLFPIQINEMDSKLFDTHVNILYCFLQSSLIHFIFSPLVKTNLINRIFNMRAINFSEKLWSVVLMILIICRIDNGTSAELTKSIELNQFLRKIVFDSNQKFELLKSHFFWILNPNSSLPVKEVIPLHAKYVFQNLPFPSSTFSKEISPRLISLLIMKAFSESLSEIEIENFISSLIDLWEANKYENSQSSILLGLCSAEALNLLVPLSMTNSTCMKFLCICLSLSCNFSTFSMVYKSIGEDHEKFLHFLTHLATQSPIVNDFVRITSHHRLNVNCFQKTVAFWIRIIKQPLTIATFLIGENTSITIKYQMSTFIFDVNQKKILFVPLKSSIDGWHFICMHFSTDSITAFVNMDQISIEKDKQDMSHFSSPVIMDIGDQNSIFDLQSVRVFHSILTEEKIKYLFFFGPNFKRLFLDNLACVNMRDKSFLFATNEGYLSNLYSEWGTQVKSIKGLKYLKDFQVDFEISPPFNFNDDTELNMTEHRFHFEPFFNSLEAFGGLSLLIHIFAEIILNEKRLHELAFNLISILLNRYPFVHQHFIKNKYYQMISQLLKKTTEKVDFKTLLKCAMIQIDEDTNGTFSNIIILNSDVLKYWLLSPSIYYQDSYEIIEKIFESLQSKYEEYNLNIIVHSPILTFISNSFLNSKEYSHKLFELLISLRLKITTKENVKENINTILQSLLEYHFGSKSEIEPKKEIELNENIEQSEIFLLHLLIQILIKFPEAINNSSLEDLIPLLTCATVKVKAVIFDILMKYLNPKFYSDFISAIQFSGTDRNFLEQIFHISFKFINVSENIIKRNNFHYMTIPLLSFISHFDVSEDLLISFCTSLNVALRNIKNYPELMINHFYISLSLVIGNPKMAEKHLQPKFENELTRIPQLLLMYINFIWIGVFKTNNQSYNIRSFLVDFTEISNFDNYVIFILSAVIDHLRENVNLNAGIVADFVCFSLKYLKFIIQLSLENNSLKPLLYIQLFIGSCIQIINELYSKFKMKNLPNYFIMLVADIESNYPDTYSTFSNELSGCKFPLKIAKSFNTFNYTNSIEKFNNYRSNKEEISNKDEVDTKTKFKNFYAKKVTEKQDSNEGIIKSWKMIFDYLHFPDSLIHENYPEKYKIDEFSKKYQIHRVLFPTNPCYERVYIENWSEKYLEKQPVIKLSMNDVINDVGISHSKSVLFSESILFLYGVKSIEGHFTMTDKKLRFYFPLNLDEIIFKLKNISRIILNDYQHQPSAFSIEDKSDNLFNFAFKNVANRIEFIHKTERIFTRNDIKIVKRFDINERNARTRSWKNGLISNFEYLIDLNFISGRSWSDFTKYPIFPWVFAGLFSKGENEMDMKNESSSNVLDSESVKSSRTQSELIDQNNENELKTESESINQSNENELKTESESINQSNENGLKNESESINQSNENGLKNESESINQSNENGLKTESESINQSNENGLKTESESINQSNENGLKTESESINQSNEDEKSLRTESNSESDSKSINLNDSNNESDNPIKSHFELSHENESHYKAETDSNLNSESDQLNDSTSTIESESFGSSNSPKKLISRRPSSSLFIQFESSNQVSESTSSISKSELYKPTDNAIMISAPDSVDNSEIDASLESLSEECKTVQPPHLQVPSQVGLKCVQSSPPVQLSPLSTLPQLSPFHSVHLTFFNYPLNIPSASQKSGDRKYKLVRSSSDFLSGSSHNHEETMSPKEVEPRPLFRIKTFEDIYSIDSKSRYQIRNFCLPFFAQTKAQQRSCIKYYQMTKRIENDPHHYSSYLSNISSALYFLVRLEPTTTFEIDHQDGRLDAADRTFQSLELTLQVMTNPDSRSAIELIPEFFFMPEIFMNVNKINFPRSPINKRIINDVIIPNWAKNHFRYVRFLRKLLESENASRTLNVWIDMVWGKLREGENALNYFNTFQKIVFNFNSDLYADDLKLLNAFRTQILNCGQAPFKLFSNLHKNKKFQPMKRKLIQFDFNDNLVEYQNIENKRIKVESFYPFIDKNDISLLVHKNNEFVFAHKNVPVISYWNIIFDKGPNSDSKSRFNIYFNDLMRGHLSSITALDLSENKFIVAGHLDGKLSTFCSSLYVHFLREIECPLNFSVSLVKVMNDNSSIIAFQNYSNESDSCLVSLFSINGFLIENLNLDDHVIDCNLSSFLNGIQTNYAFVLTKKGTIFALSMNSLNIKLKVETMRNDLVSLFLTENCILSVVTNSNVTFSWRLF